MNYYNIIFKACLAFVAVATLASCNDFLTIYPSDKIVGEEFWKKKADVDNMVAGAYRSMINHGCTERAIIWGAYRSDELVKNKPYFSTDLDNISVVNLLPTNGYSNWGDFYGVINRCNIVLQHAGEVMEADPDFSRGDYDVVCAQMKSLRAFCYFYLVRAFRDVPYTTQAYENDDMEMVIGQSTPAEVIQNCINDLEAAQNVIMRSGAYGKNDWRNWGYFTRDAVKALLCDIYLWRASMTHSSSDYDMVVKYADEIIASKDNYYKNNIATGGGFSSSDDDIYHLIPGASAYLTIFGGNSSESIFELQYDGTNNANTAVQNLYSCYDKYHMTTSILMGSKIFADVDANANTDAGAFLFESDNDYRFWDNVYDVKSGDAMQLGIRKYIEELPYMDKYVVGEKQTAMMTYDNFKRNWIVYRLTDVMLMKAEALVQLGEDESIELTQAFNIVQKVNKRSKRNITLGDTLKIEKFKSKNDMELLVLNERERELSFEGKRWFDLVRYSYRHMTGVDINTKLADNTSWPALYDKTLKLLVRKYESGGDAVSYKMKSEPFLYWPIREGEMKVNPLLKQNPVYIQDKNTQKH